MNLNIPIERRVTELLGTYNDSHIIFHEVMLHIRNFYSLDLLSATEI